MLRFIATYNWIIGSWMCAALSTALMAEELLMLTDDGPPHMIAASNNGIDIDITREVLQKMGHTVKIAYAPLKRSMRQVALKQANLFLPTFYQEDSSELFISASIINYRPTAFSLKRNHFLFNNISSLKGTNLVSFQGATGYFGREFVKAAKNSNYRELHDMSKFPEMLIRGRCDVIILDYYIFYYFLKKYLQQNPVEKLKVEDIESFELFPKVKAYVGFHDEELRNEFNKQLQIYKSQHKDKAVVYKYIGVAESEF